MFFDGWSSVGQVVILAVATYALLITALRLAGAQALAKMSAYDLVITIALGSIVATVPLSDGATLADGVAVIVTYLTLQAVVRKTLNRWPPFRNVAKNDARLVLWEGRLLDREMYLVNVSDEEVRAAIRKAGRGSLEEIQAVVLENDGQWSVIGRSDRTTLSAFRNLDLPGRRTPP
jgi:uncharacterized membrane protein YcaP (DUF421 family)